MSLGVVVDVAIGLIFSYLLLALLASGVQEVIAGLLQLRGKLLRDAITKLLSHAGADGRADSSLADRVFGHALVQGLAASSLPSYVPARNISLAILDSLMDGSQSPVFRQCEATVARMPAGMARSTLTSLLVHADGDLDHFKASLETWYDDAMDRVSGVYKRLSHYGLVGLGLVLAVALNIDSIRIADTLWHDPSLRAALAAQASDLIARQPPAAGDGPSALADAQKSVADLPVPMGWTGTAKQLSGWNWVWAIFGWIVTAFATALGAPFWFSALQGLLKIRNAGSRPERADASKSD